MSEERKERKKEEEKEDYSGLMFVGDRTIESYTWNRPLSTVEWVESNVRLGSDVSPIVGMLDLKYSPHLIEMFNDYDTYGKWKFIGEFSQHSVEKLYIYNVVWLLS